MILAEIQKLEMLELPSLGLELLSLDLEVQYSTNGCYNKVSKEVL